MRVVIRPKWIYVIRAWKRRCPCHQIEAHSAQKHYKIKSFVCSKKMKFINQTKLDKICNTLPKWDDLLRWTILEMYLSQNLQLSILTRISALRGSRRVCKASPGQRAAPPMAETSPLSQKEGSEKQSEHNVAILTALKIPSGILKNTK